MTEILFVELCRGFAVVYLLAAALLLRQGRPALEPAAMLAVVAATAEILRRLAGAEGVAWSMWALLPCLVVFAGAVVFETVRAVRPAGVSKGPFA